MVLLTLIRSLVTRGYERAATCVPVLPLFLAPAFMEHKTDLTIPPFFRAIKFAFVFAAVGFSLIYPLNRKSAKFIVSPFYMALVAFCFSMTTGVLWEFFECAMDLFFHMDLRRDSVARSQIP